MPTKPGPIAQQHHQGDYTYRVLNTYPHDVLAFTEGLVVEDSIFYESTGLWGSSSMRRVHVTSGKVDTMVTFPAQVFCEGVALRGDRLVELTWQNQAGFIYDKHSMAIVGNVYYVTEGWGLTYDGSQFIMSDGTSQLYFRDPTTFAVTRQVTVRADTGAVVNLNELEYVKGEIYANVWMTDLIARIDPADGRVLGWIDLTGLLDPADKARGADVLNGIAYDPRQDRLFVTGKLWPKMFQIELVPK